MALSLLVVLFTLISTIGYGQFICRIIFGKSANFNSGEFGLFGIVFISFISTFLHLFLPLNEFYNLILYLFGFTFFFQSKNFFLKKIEVLIIITLLFISLLMLAYHKPNEDWGYYHLPYLLNFIKEKIIFGLSTLHPNQGWNSMWLNFTATFNLPIISINGFHLANLIFFNFFSLTLFNELIKKNSKDFFNNLIKIFSIVFLIYFLVKFSRLNSYGLDVPSNFYSIYSFLLFIKFYSFSNNIKKQNIVLKKIIIFSLFAFLIKLSNALILILPLILIFYSKIRLIFMSLFFCFLFSIIWIAQQFIYTGCLLFPVIQTCLNVSWFNNGAVLSLWNHSLGINKSFAQYYGNLSEAEYSSNFNWVSTWFNRTKIELFEHLFTFLLIYIIVLFLIFLNKNKNYYKFYIKKKINKIFYLVFLVISIQILFWFSNSPLVRFGFHYVLLFLFFLLIFINKNIFFKFLNKKSIYILILFAFLFNVQKNIFRIQKDINIHQTFFYSYPKVFYRNVNNSLLETNINYLEKNSIYCWNTPAICSMDDSIKLERLNGYIFIRK
jgi:hypothetical protein